MVSRLLREAAAVFALVIFVCGTVSADEHRCVKHEEHEATTFLLVDRSDKLADTSGLKQTLKAVDEMVAPGERLLVGVITAKLSETRILLDLVRPKPSIWEATMKTRAKERAFKECFAGMEAAFDKQAEEHKTSAILETFSFVANNLNADAKAKTKRIVVYSDMMQNSDSLSFYNAKVVDPAISLQKTEKESMLWKLSGIDIYVSGAGVGVADEKARKIEQFWRQYFEKTGAVLKYYGPVFAGI